MARKKPDQANVALTEAEAEILDAVAFVEGLSRSEALRPAVQAFLTGAAGDPDVTKALEARRDRQEKQAGKTIRTLDAKRKEVRSP